MKCVAEGNVRGRDLITGELLGDDECTFDFDGAKIGWADCSAFPSGISRFKVGMLPRHPRTLSNSTRIFQKQLHHGLTSRGVPQCIKKVNI